MRINDLLFQNDANYRALVEDRTRENWIKPIKDISAYSKLSLRRYQNGQWSLKFIESGYSQAVGGNIHWEVNSTTSDVKYLWDKIQTDIALAHADKKATRTCAIDNQLPDVLWQVIWIDQFEVNERDYKYYIPEKALVIYNNDQMFEVHARLKGSYHEYSFPKRPQYSLREFV